MQTPPPSPRKLDFCEPNLWKKRYSKKCNIKILISLRSHNIFNTINDHTNMTNINNMNIMNNMDDMEFYAHAHVFSTPNCKVKYNSCINADYAPYKKKRIHRLS